METKLPDAEIVVAPESPWVRGLGNTHSSDRREPLVGLRWPFSQGKVPDLHGVPLFQFVPHIEGRWYAT